jgi:membrane fusion protein, multidrug efflux system
MIKNRSQLFIVMGIVAFTAVVFVAMNIFKPTAPLEKLEDPVERLEAVLAKRQDVFPIVKTQAVVESRYNINLKSQVAGQIVYASPKFLTGGFFDTDEVILKIDPSDYELALVQAEVNVARAEQVLSIEKEHAELAKLDWEKYGVGEASDLVLRIPQLNEAEAGLKGAIANYDTQKIRLDRTDIKAPFPLMVQQKLVDLGQIVSANQDLIEVFGTEEAEIRMPLSQTQIDLLNIMQVGMLEPADTLDVKVRDLTRNKDISWQAKISRIESSIDRKSRVYYAIGTIMDPMNLKKDKTTPPLLPGVFVELEIQGPKIENVFKLPIRAMQDDDNIFVFSDNKLITKPVVVLDRDEKFVSIISGIEENENVVISPPFSYVPGMKSELASLDGVPVGGPPGARQRASGGARPAATTPGGPGTASAAENPQTPNGQDNVAKGQTGNMPDRAAFANMTPEQRQAAIANMTPEQRAAMQARREARNQNTDPQGGAQ